MLLTSLKKCCKFSFLLALAVSSVGQPWRYVLLLSFFFFYVAPFFAADLVPHRKLLFMVIKVIILECVHRLFTD